MQDHSLLSRMVLSNRITIQDTNASCIANFKISSSHIKNNKKKQINFLKIQIYIANRSKISSFKHVINTNVILYIVFFFHLSLQNLVYSTLELLQGTQGRKAELAVLSQRISGDFSHLAPLTFWDQVPSTTINSMNYLLPMQQIIFYLKGFFFWLLLLLLFTGVLPPGTLIDVNSYLFQGLLFLCIHLNHP